MNEFLLYKADEYDDPINLTNMPKQHKYKKFSKNKNTTK